MAMVVGMGFLLLVIIKEKDKPDAWARKEN
jgi:hypothetical protein